MAVTKLIQMREGSGQDHANKCFVRRVGGVFGAPVLLAYDDVVLRMVVKKTERAQELAHDRDKEHQNLKAVEGSSLARKWYDNTDVVFFEVSCRLI